VCAVDLLEYDVQKIVCLSIPNSCVVFVTGTRFRRGYFKF
jgi:hypothetical protein